MFECFGEFLKYDSMFLRKHQENTLQFESKFDIRKFFWTEKKIFLQAHYHSCNSKVTTVNFDENCRQIKTESKINETSFLR